MIYRITRAFARFILWLCYRCEIAGDSNVPAGGPAIICANHTSWWDPIVVGCCISRPVRFMAKEELFRLPVSGWFLRMLGAFPVKRGAPDLKAFKTALSVLDRGEVLGLFPEGTRSKDRRIHKAELGAAAIALKTGAPVVPVAVASSYHIKDTVTVAIGKPLAFGSGEKRHDPYSGGKEKPGTVLDNFGSGNHMGGPCDKDDGKGGKNERYRQVSNEIMEAIGRLLDGSQDTVESE